MKKTIFLTFMILLITSATLISGKFGYETAQTLGMGGIYLGTYDYEDVLWSNIAGLSKQKTWYFKLIDIRMNFNQDLVDAGLSAYETLNESDTIDFGKLISQVKSARPSFGLYLPIPAFTFTKKNWGFGFHSSVNVTARARNTSDIINAYGEGSLINNNIFKFAYAKHIDIKKEYISITPAAAVKFLYRNKLNITKANEKVIAINDEYYYIDNTIKDTYPDKKTIDDMTENIPDLLDSSMAVGLDLVVEGSLLEQFNGSISVEDIYFGLNEDDNPMNINLGGVWSPHIKLGRFMQPGDLEMGIGFYDILSSKNVFLKTHVGIKASMFHLLGAKEEVPPLLSFYGGINGGYITFGTQFNLRFFKINYATSTSERGIYPGQNPDIKHFLNIIFII